MKTKLFGDREFYRKLWHLTLPIAFQALMLASVAASDAIMLGRLDQNSMAAVSLATQVQFVQNLSLTSLTATIAILGAQYWGKHDLVSINKVFCIGLRLSVLISAVFAFACCFASPVIMKLFASDAELIRIGSDYLRIAGASYLITGISQCYLSTMKISENAKLSAKIASSVVVINIILNAVFIFGLFGMPAMGAKGAALATLLSRIIEFVWVIAASYGAGRIHPELKKLFAKDKALTKDFYKCSLPLLGASLLWGVGFTSYTAVMGHMGADAAAANSVSAVVRDLMCCLCDGISSAGGILVGNELGHGDLEKGRVYGDRLVLLSFFIGILSTALVLLVTPLVLSYIKLTPKAYSYLKGMMIIMAIYMIGRCMNTIIINGVFAAGGDTMFDMYSLVVAMWLLAIPCAFLGAFVFHWPVLLVYSCTCLDEVGKIPWVLFHNKKHKWVKDLTR